MAPPSVSTFLPLDFGFIWPFNTGDWAQVPRASRRTLSASPAINTAEWTATWADGTKTTLIAKDYVYIVDGEVGKRMFVTKQLLDPLPAAAMSDTVTFRVTVTNVTKRKTCPRSR